MPKPDPTETIELSVSIAARPSTVFRFFSDPDRYRKWMGAESTIDPRLHGTLTVKFGAGPTACGRIVEMVTDERIVFTWGHEGAATKLSSGASRVTITLRPTAQGTLVTLRHEGITSDAERAGTTSGWRYYLSALAAASVGERIGDTAEKVVDRYIAAWAETDAVNRASLLTRCIATELRFRDGYGCIDGRDNLNAYIGGAQMMLRGARLERTGPVARTHDFLRHDWRITGPDGSIMGAGENLYELDTDNLIRTAVGFWNTKSGI